MVIQVLAKNKDFEGFSDAVGLFHKAVKESMIRIVGSSGKEKFGFGFNDYLLKEQVTKKINSETFAITGECQDLNIVVCLDIGKHVFESIAKHVEYEKDMLLYDNIWLRFDKQSQYATIPNKFQRITIKYMLCIKTQKS